MHDCFKMNRFFLVIENVLEHLIRFRHLYYRLCLFTKSVLVVLVHNVTVSISLMWLFVAIDNDAID